MIKHKRPTVAEAITEGKELAIQAAEEAQTEERNASILFLRNSAFNIAITAGKAACDGQTAQSEALLVQQRALLIAAETFERGGHRL